MTPLTRRGFLQAGSLAGATPPIGEPWYSDSGMWETAFPVDSESVKTTKGQAMTELEQRACDMRIDIVRMIAEAGSGHPGGSLSCTDILTALYFGGVMDHDPEQPKWEDRDRFVLAKGHAAPALYAALAITAAVRRREQTGEGARITLPWGAARSMP